MGSRFRGAHDRRAKVAGMSSTEMRTPAQRVHVGAIAEVLRTLEIEGPVLVLGSKRSVAAVDWGGLESRLALTYFDRSEPHNPQRVVDEAIRLARDVAPRTIIAVGSASAIDLGKTVRKEIDALAVAIPSTLGGAEMSRGYGVLQATHEKAVGATRHVYAEVCYDPELLATLPTATLGASGLNAWAHTIEARYAGREHWLGRAAAEAAGRRLPALLLEAAASRHVALHRQLFEAAHLAGFALNACGMAIHHATCHALGGLTRIPHGVLNAMVLPHALRLNGRLAPAALAEVAASFAIVDLVWEAERVRDAYKLPRTLAELGVPRETTELAIEPIFASPLLRNNPAPVERGDLVDLLCAVYG
ncbi:iron-containing alcohol dehydrogenase [bacterium]|nr:MAG: iron-containing alcohol dehydrogenase [bacterium]